MMRWRLMRHHLMRLSVAAAMIATLAFRGAPDWLRIGVSVVAFIVAGKIIHRWHARRRPGGGTAPQGDQ